MYGLNKIILLNSFITNRLSSVDCPGNTNHSGDNGTGKTSLLKLIPFFWGAEPFSLSTRVADKQSFLDWYLPHSSSFIIFEYCKEDGNYFVLIYRHPSDKGPAYRFVKGIFDASILRVGSSEKDIVKAMPVSELIKKLLVNDFDVSNQINTVNRYRAIIQHDRQLLKELDSKGALKRMAVRYSVVGQKGYMRHMEKMTSAVLKRTKLFDSLKIMLGSILEEQAVAIPKPPAHSKNSLIREDLACLRGFTTNRANFIEVINDYYERVSLKTKISRMGRSLVIEHEKKIKSQDKFNQDIDALDQELREFEISHEEKFRIINKNKIEHENTRDDAKKRIDRLYKEREEWNKKDIDIKVSEYALLENLEYSEEQARLNLKAMQEGVEDLQHEYEKSLQNEKTRHATSCTLFEKQLNENNNKKRTLENLYFKSKENISAENNNNILRIENEYKHIIESLISNSSKERTKANTIGITDEEELSLNALESKLDEYDALIFAKENKLIEVKNKCVQARSEYKKSLLIIENKDVKINDLSLYLAAKEKQLNPEAGTFHEALKNKDKNWINNIGKIVNIDVLNNNNLSPRKIDESNSLYGWEIDLNKINLPLHAQTEDQIKQDIKDTDIKLAQEIINIEKAENNGLYLKSIFDILEKEKNEIVRDIELDKNVKINLISQKNILKIDINENRQKKRNEAQFLANEIDEEIVRTRLNVESKKYDMEVIYDELCDEEKIKFDRDMDILTGEERNTIKNKELENNSHEELKNEFKDIYLKACKNNGYDSDAIEKSNKTYNKCIKKVKKVKSWNNDIEQYKYWLENELTTKSKYTNIYQEGESKVREALAQANALEGAAQKKRKFISSEKNKIKSIIIKIVNDITEINLTLERIGGFSKSAEPIDLPMFSLIAESISCIDRELELRNSISKGVRQAQNIINSFPHSDLRSAWDQLVSDRAVSCGMDSSDARVYEHLPLDLEHLVENHIPQLRRATLEKIKAIGHQIYNFYSGLLKIKQSIHSLADQVSQAIAHKQIIHNLEDINFNLLPTIENLEYWQELREFHEHWEKWETNDELPSEGLELSLGDALEKLRAAKITDRLDSYFTLTISLRENGTKILIHDDNDLNEASSNGLSYLAICIIFRGLTRFLCVDNNIKIHWPIDELATLSPQNITKLIKMLNESGIYLFSGFPSTDQHLLQHFETKNTIDYKSGIKKIRVIKR